VIVNRDERVSARSWIYLIPGSGVTDLVAFDSSRSVVIFRKWIATAVFLITAVLVEPLCAPDSIHLSPAGRGSTLSARLHATRFHQAGESLALCIRKSSRIEMGVARPQRRLT